MKAVVGPHKIYEVGASAERKQTKFTRCPNFVDLLLYDLNEILKGRAPDSF